LCCFLFRFLSRFKVEVGKGGKVEILVAYRYGDSFLIWKYDTHSRQFYGFESGHIKKLISVIYYEVAHWPNTSENKELKRT
jgi:hypothetical protein